MGHKVGNKAWEGWIMLCILNEVNYKCLIKNVIVDNIMQGFASTGDCLVPCQSIR